MSAPRRNEGDLPSAVSLCRANARLMDALGDIYARIDKRTCGREASCLGGGACCRFDLTAHRLYASTAELAMLSGLDPADPTRCERRRCPYQIGPRCSARSARPLGCRVFFCEKDLDDWCAKLYETFHREIRSLHESLGMPYVYTELTDALSEIFAHSRAADAR